MTEPTPTPWFKNSKFEIGPRPRTGDQSDGMLHPVAEAFGDNADADAAFIVNVANAWYNADALRTRLAELERYVDKALAAAVPPKAWTDAKAEIDSGWPEKETP